MLSSMSWHRIFVCLLFLVYVHGPWSKWMFIGFVFCIIDCELLLRAVIEL